MKVNKTAHFGSCNLSIQKAEAGGLPGRVQGYPGVVSQRASLGYSRRPHLQEYINKQ